MQIQRFNQAMAPKMNNRSVNNQSNNPSNNVNFGIKLAIRGQQADYYSYFNMPILDYLERALPKRFDVTEPSIPPKREQIIKMVEDLKEIGGDTRVGINHNMDWDSTSQEVDDLTVRTFVEYPDKNKQKYVRMPQTKIIKKFLLDDDKTGTEVMQAIRDEQANQLIKALRQITPENIAQIVNLVE